MRLDAGIGRWVKVTASRVLLLLLAAICLAGFAGCRQRTTEGPEMAFEQSKWRMTDRGGYPYRRRMLRDLQEHRKWAGVPKDTVIKILGLPDQQVEGNLWYKYDQELTLLGYSDNILVVELAPDSTVKAISVRNSGFD